MAENNFNDYLQQIRERDKQIAKEQPLPEVQGVNCWIMFGLAIGIGSIILGFINGYSAILALFAFGLSYIGYKKSGDSLAVKGMICSCVGFAISVIFAIIKMIALAILEGSWQGIIQSIFGH